MAESMTEDKSPPGYVSCIKINGKSILPPLMSAERRAEMKQYKEMAIAIEATLNLKRNSVDSGVMIAPSPRSSFWVNRRSMDISGTATSENTQLSSTSELTPLFDKLQKFSAEDSNKYLWISDEKKNETSAFISNVVQGTASHFGTVEVINRSENHNVMPNQMIARTEQALSSEEKTMCEVSLPCSEKENRVPFQEHSLLCHVQSEVKLVPHETIDSILPFSSLAFHDKINLATVSFINKPELEMSSVEPLRLREEIVELADESTIPVRKIQASLNISEIVAHDDIIQDGLGFKVWKNSCEALKKRPQYSSTPADTTEENIESTKSENLDESVSSIAVTASTDLNNYMNTSDSSKSSTSVQSLSSVTAAVHEPDIFKQTSADNPIPCRTSLENKIAKQTLLQDDVKKAGGPSINRAAENLDNLGIAGIRPLDSESEYEDVTPPNAELLGMNVTDEFITVKKSKEICIEEKTSSESRTSSDTPTPRLKRQHSYTLESPSPLLVEHLKICTYDGDMTISPTKKMLSSSKREQGGPKHRSLQGAKCNASLPNSAVTSPIKLQSPFASSDCLSFTVPKENTKASKNTPRKTFASSKENKRKSHCISTESLRTLSLEERPSNAKKTVQNRLLASSCQNDFVDNTSTEVSKKSCRLLIKTPKTPQKTPRNELRKNSSPLNQNISPKKSAKIVAPANQEQLVLEPTPKKLPVQEELRALFLQLQTEHQQQMAELIEKQKKEQEALREAFREQQSHLMSEIRNIYPTVFSTPESHKLLEKSVTEPLNSDLKTVKSEKTSSSGSPLKSKIKDTQENVKQLEERPHKVNLSSKQVENEGGMSELHQLDEISVTNTSTSDVAETLAKTKPSFSPEVHQNKPKLSIASEHMDFSNAVISGNGNNAEQKTLHSPHAEENVIHHLQHLEGVSSTSLQNVSTSTSDITEAYDNKTASLDVDGNEVTQQAVYSMHLDGKVVTRVLTVAKSEVILSEGLPYSEPREETIRTTVYTQLNGVEHNGMVDAQFSTMMQGKRQSCNRELFPAYSRFRESYTRVHEFAASRIQAGVRGYLTRRLFRTARVQDLITTIRDTLLCAVQLTQECWPDVQPEDVELHRRLIQQVTAACYALHDVFFSLPVSEQMMIIAADRERLRSHAPRTPVPRPLSAATRRALERKMMQNGEEERPRNVRTRRTWSAGSEKSSGSYGIARSCLLRQQQETSQSRIAPRTRHSTSSTVRRPWR